VSDSAGKWDDWLKHLTGIVNNGIDTTTCKYTPF